MGPNSGSVKGGHIWNYNWIWQGNEEWNPF